ncbi:MAG: hypothetical protein PWR20_670 [Bacteroidales bacterium]|jgi:hypothetical protein|nr:hypothetical protein [Bacteroidales bacterium]MDN5328785.1 hypothetical protein [Bacteroidales bacterium]
MSFIIFIPVLWKYLNCFGFTMSDNYPLTLNNSIIIVYNLLSFLKRN